MVKNEMWNTYMLSVELFCYAVVMSSVWKTVDKSFFHRLTKFLYLEKGFTLKARLLRVVIINSFFKFFFKLLCLDLVLLLECRQSFLFQIFFLLFFY